VQDAPCREPADAANHQVGDGAGRQQKDEDLAVSTRYARPQSPTVMVKVSRADVAGSAVMAARRPANVAHLTSGPAGQRPPRYLHHSALVQSQDKTQGRKGNEAARVGNPLDERHRPAVQGCAELRHHEGVGVRGCCHHESKARSTAQDALHASDGKR